MTDDPRCCGSGACIVDPAGQCWCGQRWDGEKMCRPPLPALLQPEPAKQPADAPDRGVPLDRA